jgi:excisionase family DNA binding protein
MTATSPRPADELEVLVDRYVGRFVDHLAELLADRIDARLEALHQARGDDRAGYDVTEVATRLGVSERTVWDLINTEQLRSVKVGRRRVIPASALARLLADGTDLGSNLGSNSRTSAHARRSA